MLNTPTLQVFLITENIQVASTSK